MENDGRSKIERSPTESMHGMVGGDNNFNPVFGSARVPVNSSTPYSDATQVSAHYLITYMYVCTIIYFCAYIANYQDSSLVN